MTYKRVVNQKKELTHKRYDLQKGVNQQKELTHKRCDLQKGCESKKKNQLTRGCDLRKGVLHHSGVHQVYRY